MTGETHAHSDPSQADDVSCIYFSAWRSSVCLFYFFLFVLLFAVHSSALLSLRVSFWGRPDGSYFILPLGSTRERATHPFQFGVSAPSLLQFVVVAVVVVVVGFPISMVRPIVIVDG